MRQAIWAIALVLVSCTEVSTPSVATPPGLFDHPQALVFVGDRLVVANTGYDAQEWRPGSLVVIDSKTLSVRARFSTAHDNPQRLVVAGEMLYVVETGVLDLKDFEDPQTETTGAVERFALDSLDAGRATDVMAMNIAPVDFAAQGNGGVVSSGLTPAVWSIELDSFPQPDSLAGPHGLMPSTPLGLGSLRPWRDGFVIVDFNSDRAHLLDAEGMPTGCSADLGSSTAVEGAQSPWVEGDELYVILAFAGVVRKLPLDVLEARCDAAAETVIPALGQIPNDLHLRGDELFVVHSGDNNVVVYGRVDGVERRRYVLPRGANPWHAAFSDDGQFMAVTEWSTQGVSIFDLNSGAVRRLGGPLEDEPDSTPARAK